MNADPRPPAKLSVLALTLSLGSALLLGLASGAAVDRALTGRLGPALEFAAGLITAAVVAAVVGILSYRALTRRNG